MSSILKALKKLENEKTQRRPALLHIDADILRPGEEKRRFSPVSIGVLALLLFVGGSVATYLLMTRLMPPLRTADAPAQQQSSPRTPAPVIGPHSTVAPPVIPTEPLPAKIVVMPAASAPVSRPVVKQPLQRPATPQQAGLKSALPSPVVASPVPASLPGGAPPQPTAVGQVVPLLRINGIAFQKEGSDTMAIVNGTPVSAGSFVDGAQVEEITKDRVRFRYRGEKLEVLLGQSNR